MRRDDDPLQRLRAAIDELAAADAGGLVAEARAEARARVRSRLTDALTESLVEQVEHQLASTRAPAPAARADPEPAPARADLAAAAAHGERAWYVYGVVDSAIDPGAAIPGVDAAHPIETVREGAIAAVVSRVALEEFGEDRLREHLRDMEWVETVARAHERVLDEVRARTTVVPMRMCTVYRTDDGVQEMLRRESRSLREAIEHLDGKAEWGVKAFADIARLARGEDEGEVAAADSGQARGAAYMRRRRDERDRRERAREVAEESAARIHERLLALAADGHVIAPQRPEVSGHAGEMVLNGVYLVADGALERFHEEVGDIQSELGPAGIDVDLTGPWPAYNFVPGTIGAAW